MKCKQGLGGRRGQLTNAGDIIRSALLPTPVLAPSLLESSAAFRAATAPANRASTAPVAPASPEVESPPVVASPVGLASPARSVVMESVPNSPAVSTPPADDERKMPALRDPVSNASFVSFQRIENEDVPIEIPLKTSDSDANPKKATPPASPPRVPTVDEINNARNKFQENFDRLYDSIPDSFFASIPLPGTCPEPPAITRRCPNAPVKSHEISAAPKPHFVESQQNIRRMEIVQEAGRIDAKAEMTHAAHRMATTQPDKTAEEIWDELWAECSSTYREIGWVGIDIEAVRRIVKNARKAQTGGSNKSFWSLGVHEPNMCFNIKSDKLMIQSNIKINCTRTNTDDLYDQLIVFGHPEHFHLLKYQGLNLYCDGTFKCVPDPFSQLLIFMVFDQGKSFSIILC